MKVFLEPTGLHSKAMLRVSEALTRHAPEGVEVVKRAEEADMRVLHVIGPVDYRTVDSNTIIIQYCYKTAGMEASAWFDVWKRARLVWSYYDLPEQSRYRFFYAPLGVDTVFTRQLDARQRERHLVITSGYVSSDKAEAIEEVADAALRTRRVVCHIGPRAVEGMQPRTEKTWEAFYGVSDNVLARLYSNAQWVSGLRHLEGFELPVVEGAVCGATPIVFDRPDMHWHKEYSEVIQPCHGRRLVEQLAELFSSQPKRLSRAMRTAIAHRYDWSVIAPAFWRAAL